MARSSVLEILRLRRTLLSWRTEILNYFDCPITNGRTEGFNNKAKLVKKRAYGYRSFANYRLRLLTPARERLSPLTHHRVSRTEEP
jgi:transposase